MGIPKGANYGFENTKAMVLNRDNYTCQCCKGKHKDSKLEVHHIVFRSQGGSDEESNLLTLCHTCHKDLHSGKINPKLSGKVKGNLKYATQMNSIRKQLFRFYPNAIETFGYVTKANRLHLGVDKEHYYDACTIATQGNAFNVKSNLYKRNVFLMVIFKRLKVFVLNNLLLQIRFVVLESLIRFGILEMITLSKEECLRICNSYGY